ncbi:MAG: prepilin-type N-terminal cleavage/methylation domain-containing protein [Lachnospiraceae bacterium]|nr:prepilin-type N-terminal cleavage/methylation domain-containing protein [Lachnospiraceae bacterium]
MKKNKGYTLIEMLIVIAIMAILTGVAFVTLKVMHQAKYNSSISTFQTQLSNLWIQTKAISQSKVQLNPTDATDGAKYPLCMVVTLNEDSSDDIRDGSFEVKTAYNKDTDVTDKESHATLTHLVDIKYTPTNSKQVHSKTSIDGSGFITGDVIIQFNKADGSVKYGAGTYDFYYDNRVVGTVYLDSVTGNHYVK